MGFDTFAKPPFYETALLFPFGTLSQQCKENRLSLSPPPQKKESSQMNPKFSGKEWTHKHTKARNCLEMKKKQCFSSFQDDEKGGVELKGGSRHD